MIDEALLSRPLAWEDAQTLSNQAIGFFPDEANPEAVALQVVSVTARERSGEQRQFSILFRGPPDPVFAQGTYRFRHSRLGDYAIFITPIAQRPEGTDYEACFFHAA